MHNDVECILSIYLVGNFLGDIQTNLLASKLLRFKFTALVDNIDRKLCVIKQTRMTKTLHNQVNCLKTTSIRLNRLSWVQGTSLNIFRLILRRGHYPGL